LRGYEISIAQNQKEIQEALSLRRMVFVEEQQMFEKNDLDANDDNAIHINAWSVRKNILVGTVRCFPDQQNNSVWWGGRLAVHPDFRIKGIGVYLIRAAVDAVKTQQANRFLANVLSKNVELFEKLGWVPVGKSFDSFGHPHQLMEVDLNVHDAQSLQLNRDKFNHSC
jgi:putative N-acetyltransferase (TIGR04045 family)